LLVVLLFINSGGYLWVYWTADAWLYQVHISRVQGEAEYEEESLEVLSFSKAFLAGESEKLEWVEEKEFRFEGRMYDVFEKEVLQDSVRFYVERDHAEEGLNTAFKQTHEREATKASKQQNSNLLGWLKLIIQNARCQKPVKLTLNRPPQPFNIPYLVVLVNNSIQVETPPPRYFT